MHTTWERKVEQENSSTTKDTKKVVKDSEKVVNQDHMIGIVPSPKQGKDLSQEIQVNKTLLEEEDHNQMTEDLFPNLDVTDVNAESVKPTKIILTRS